MTEPTVIRFEAIDIEPALFDETALLMIEAAEGRIAIHMQRHVFVALFEQMRIALGPEAPHVRTPSAS